MDQAARDPRLRRPDVCARRGPTELSTACRTITVNAFWSHPCIRAAESGQLCSAESPPLLRWWLSSIDRLHTLNYFLKLSCSCPSGRVASRVLSARSGNRRGNAEGVREGSTCQLPDCALCERMRVAAVELATSRGVRALTNRGIARRARLSPEQALEHYASVDDCLTGAYDEGCELMIAACTPALSGEGSWQRPDSPPRARRRSRSSLHARAWRASA